MSQKISVRPSRAGVVAGLFTALAFLVFGIVFLIVLAKEESWIGVGFLAFWNFCVLLMAGYLVHLLKSRKGVIEIETGPLAGEGPKNESFAARLRDLDALRKDGLVTDDEYRAKRAEILNEKW